jgi:hypothetical protein
VETIVARFKFDKISGKVIPVEEWDEIHAGGGGGNSANVAKSFTAFKSTVDGSIISDRRQLAAHNKRNGVTNIGDYGQKHFDDAGARMAKERVGDTKADDKDRRHKSYDALRKHGLLR